MGAYSTQILATSGLIAYYKATEPSGTTMTDSSGVVGNATYAGSGVSLGQTGLVPIESSDTSVFFDGINGRAQIASSATLQLTTAISFIAWVKPTIVRTQHVIYKFGSYGMSMRGSYFSWELDTVGAIGSPAGSVVAGNTYMVAGTYNGTAQTLYLNGYQVATASRSNQSMGTNSNALEIGSVIAAEKWGGYLAHLSLFNTGLSAATIQNLYKLGVETTAAVPGSSAHVFGFSSQVVAANPSRQRITIYNDSDTTVYLALGSTATVGAGPRLDGGGDRWTSTHYTGAISAIHNGYIGAKNLTIIEE